MKRSLSALFTALLTCLLVMLGAVPAHATASTYVAYGDSYPYGFGLPPSSGYPALLAAGSSLNLVLDAAPGRTAADILAEVRSLPRDNSVRAVTVTAGGSDVAWVDVLLECRDGCDAAEDPAFAALPQNLAQLGLTMAKLGKELHRAYPNAKIFVTGYPELFGVLPRDCTVQVPLGGGLVPVSVDRASRVQVNAMVNALDLSIRTGASLARKAGAPVTYVDVVHAFRGHRLCDVSTSWLQQGPGAFHPTEKGQAVYAARIQANGFPAGGGH